MAYSSGPALPGFPPMTNAGEPEAEAQIRLDDVSGVLPHANAAMDRNARLAYQAVLGVLHSFATTICIARNLADGERELDLSGLHETAGLLCARALDLRPEHGRKLIPRLRSVLEELDALYNSLAPSQPDAGARRA